mmetsp:Transcript_21709/g.62773  ORF Transcript_21709/g.62773 Transcript_21709/m.62773 type:complete len:281 (-) Transcript_21709:257-1099(-)
MAASASGPSQAPHATSARLTSSVAAGPAAAMSKLARCEGRKSCGNQTLPRCPKEAEGSGACESLTPWKPAASVRASTATSSVASSSGPKGQTVSRPGSASSRPGSPRSCAPSAASSACALQSSSVETASVLEKAAKEGVGSKRGRSSRRNAKIDASPACSPGCRKSSTRWGSACSRCSSRRSNALTSSAAPGAPSAKRPWNSQTRGPKPRAASREKTARVSASSRPSLSRKDASGSISPSEAATPNSAARAGKSVAATRSMASLTASSLTSSAGGKLKRV